MADPKRFDDRHRQTVPTEHDDDDNHQQIDGMGTTADFVHGNDSPPSYEASVAVGAAPSDHINTRGDLHGTPVAQDTVNTARPNENISTPSSSTPFNTSTPSSNGRRSYGSRWTRSSSSSGFQSQPQQHPWNPIPRPAIIPPMWAANNNSNKPYQPPPPMSPTPLPTAARQQQQQQQEQEQNNRDNDIYPFDQATYDRLQHAPGCCCSTRGGCFFSDMGGCCFSSMGGCCFAGRGGCCFADRGGCCFASNGGCCCCSN